MTRFPNRSILSVMKILLSRHKYEPNATGNETTSLEGGGVGVDVSVRTCDFEHVIVWARHDGCLGCSEC